MTVKVRGPAVRWAVSGAPYYGVMSSGRESTLPDGTHVFKAAPITRKMWRDSQGRMRTEHVLQGDGGEFMVADINDPVAGLAYVMDDNIHVIHRFTMVPLAEWKRPPQKQAEARRQRSFEQIGERNIEGVAVSGRRMTEVIPAGEAGNDKPVVLVSDFWYSRELRMDILTEIFDPRNEKGTNRMTNISLAEPDASLFSPPAGFTIIDEKDWITMILKRQ